MNAKHLIAEFDRIMGAPEAFPRFESFIVQLAVRGQLVSPDPDDQPAESIVAAIQSEKAALDHASRKLRTRDPITSEETPYRVPISWTWARTQDLCVAIVDCPHSTPRFEREGVVCLDTNSIKDGDLIANKIRYVSEETFRERVKRLTPQAGDIVFAREGSVGQSVVIPEGMRSCLGQRVMLFRTGHGVIPEYFRYAISEQSALLRLMSLHKGIGARHVNVGDMRRVLIPLPPEAE